MEHRSGVLPKTSRHRMLEGVMPIAERSTPTDVPARADVGVAVSSAVCSNPRPFFVGRGSMIGRVSAERMRLCASGVYQSGVVVTDSRRRYCCPPGVLSVISAEATILVHTVKEVAPAFVRVGYSLPVAICNGV